MHFTGSQGGNVLLELTALVRRVSVKGFVSGFSHLLEDFLLLGSAVCPEKHRVQLGRTGPVKYIGRYAKMDLCHYY